MNHHTLSFPLLPSHPISFPLLPFPIFSSSLLPSSPPITHIGVWNTWQLGLWEQSGGGFQTHTHFLTTGEWDILKAFSKRGLLFARKFSTKKTSALLDMIDEYMIFNKSTEAGKNDDQ